MKKFQNISIPIKVADPNTSVYDSINIEDSPNFQNQNDLFHDEVNDMGRSYTIEEKKSPIKIARYTPSMKQSYSIHSTDRHIMFPVDIMDNEYLQYLITIIKNEGIYSSSITSDVQTRTFDLLNDEKVSFIDSINVLGVIFLFKKVLDIYETELLVMDNENYHNEGYQLYDLHLLSSNVNDFIIRICIKESLYYTYSELASNEKTKNKVLNELKSIFKEACKTKPYFFNDNREFIILQMSEINENICFDCYMPYFIKNYYQELLEVLRERLTKQIGKGFESITYRKIVQFCRMTTDDIDLWGYKVFKETLFMSEEKIRGGLKYYQPSKGFVRFGLNVCRRFLNDGETDWFATDGNENEWAVCYCNINLDAHISEDKSNILTQLFSSEDIGPNKDNFSEKNCGLGIIATPDLTLFDGQNLEESMKEMDFTERNRLSFFALDQLEIRDINFKSHLYLVAMQCRVNPKKIRIPKGFANKIYLINNPDDIRPYGVLIKKI